MKFWFKRVLVGLVVVVIVALVGLAIFLLTFDPNAYKSKLEEIVYNRYHRSLVVKGDIELSLFPRIGLSLQDVSLSDRESSDTFASVDSARFAVAIWPLMFNRLVVDHVAVSGFKAWVVRNAAGEFNFRDLLDNSVPGIEPPASPPPSTPASHASKLPALLRNHEAARTDFQIDIAGLDLKNGEIHYRDYMTGARARVEKLTVNTGRVTFDQPFDVALQGKLIGAYPKAQADIEGQAVVRFNPLERTYSAQKINVQVAGTVGDLQAKSASLRGNLAYSDYTETLTASSLALTVQGSGQGSTPVKNLDISLSVPQLKADRSQSELKLEKLALRAKGNLPDQSFDVAVDAPSLSISPESAKGDAVSGTVKLTGQKTLGLALGISGLGGNAQHLTLKELKIEGGLKHGQRLVQFNLSSPAVWNSIRQRGELSAMKGDVKIQAPALPGGSFEFPMIGSLHADLVKDQLNSEINAVLSGSKLDFKVQATRLADPKVVFDLSADSLDFNKLFPPAQPKPAAKPQDKAQAADQDKSKDKAQAAPAQPAAKAAAAAAAAPQPIDLSFLQPLDVTGTVKVGDLRVRGLRAKQFDAGLRVAGGKLAVAPLSASLYGGTLKGTLSADAGNTLAANLALNKVSLLDLLQGLGTEGRFAGQANVSLDVHSQGTTSAALVAGLDGTVHANVQNGAIIGINIDQTLNEISAAVHNMFSGQVPDVQAKFDPSRRTNFANLDAAVLFAQGEGTVKKFNLTGSTIKTTIGSPASIDLVNRQMDCTVDVHVLHTLSQTVGNLTDFMGVAVPIRVSGPFDALNYQVQWKDIGSAAVRRALQGGLLDMLANKVGKGLLPAQDKLPAPAAPSSDINPVKSIGNALKGLLGQ
ncbi:AsmA family protein [Candidimonas nitroreducens]|uniref:AsmA family protein n=1 Tax=Candidimonas nitroreducens TaxID=683354 RepID=A0A225MAW4_9BURK|nr:AsmA family protein [Candidimonas nitroreducens]OWT58407.1 AsmA family protein [Candidimonas nitroreducens]